VLENRVLRKILGSRREKVNRIQGAIYYLHDKIKQNEVGGACCVCGEKKMCTGFWWGNLKERDCLKSMHIDGRIILKLTLNKWVGGWIGFIWLKIGTSYGLL
jgi:hypothetical protein